jgi:hypothetical protein
MSRISYILSLPQEHELVHVIHLLQRLQHRCVDLPFLEVTNIRIDSNPKMHKSLVFPGLKPIEAIGFMCRMGGKGSQPLSLFLYRYPKHRGVSIPWVHRSECWAADDDPSYMARHAAATEVLDYASRIGFGIDVKDVLGYWKNRDRRAADLVRKQLTGVPPWAGARSIRLPPGPLTEP